MHPCINIRVLTHIHTKADTSHKLKFTTIYIYIYIYIYTMNICSYVYTCTVELTHNVEVTTYTKHPQSIVRLQTAPFSKNKLLQAERFWRCADIQGFYLNIATIKLRIMMIILLHLKRCPSELNQKSIRQKRYGRC